jgi:S-adenosylmethionine:tRNA ribosyltransferase-isomerase
MRRARKYKKMKHSINDYDFNLPDDLIATHPAEPRDSSRLLVLDKKTGKIEHQHFYNIIDYLNTGDILVLNNSKVIPARLLAVKKETGGKVEVLLHKKLSGNIWQCLIGGKVKENLHLSFRAKAAAAEVEEPLRGVSDIKRSFDSANAPLRMTKKEELFESTETSFDATNIILSAELLKNNHDGTWDVKFSKSGAALMKAIEKIGEVPLPPYIVKQREKTLSFRAAPGGEEPLKASGNIKRSFDSADASLRMTNIDDNSDYQTVFADDKKSGSVAAPTAGLHFTPELLKKIKAKGVKILEITLYVGMGTFAPVKVEDFTKHKMHAEWVEISKSSIINLQSAIKNKQRVIAVGTTSARSLEACFTLIANEKTSSSAGRQRGASSILDRGEFKSWVDIFIYPGYKFKIVDAMITNFHLPKSTLLMLVSALAGKKNIDKAYREAIEKKYHFYSYGDAMFIK